MSETSTALAADDTKPCKVCGEPIKKVARVCYHCTNYQDWRGEIAVGSAVLSLLVALFSVLTVAVPIILDAFTPRNSALSFAFQAQSDKVLTVLVTNQGVRSGSVAAGASLRTSADKYALGGYPLTLSGVDTSVTAAMLVEPSASHLLNYTWAIPGIKAAVTKCNSNPLTGAQDMWSFLFLVTDFKAVTSNVVMPVKCGDVYYWVSHINDSVQPSPQSPPQTTPQ
jgi:hypothetical protein